MRKNNSALNLSHVKLLIIANFSNIKTKDREIVKQIVDFFPEIENEWEKKVKKMHPKNRTKWINYATNSRLFIKYYFKKSNEKDKHILDFFIKIDNNRQRAYLLFNISLNYEWNTEKRIKKEKSIKNKR